MSISIISTIIITITITITITMTIAIVTIIIIITIIINDYHPAGRRPRPIQLYIYYKLFKYYKLLITHKPFMYYHTIISILYNRLHFSICACHPCARAMLIFSFSFQF